MVRPLARRGPDDQGLALFDPEAGCAAALLTAGSVIGATAGPPSPARESVVCPAGPVGEHDLRFDHRIAMGHTRFSIIDPSPSGHQPFWSHDGSVCISLNGEIYNYLELRAELEACGRWFRTRTDTEVLVEAYLEWGEECFDRFVGFWAIALYDRRKEAMLLARDRMGKAPLYIARVNGTLYWSSEIKSLRAGAGTSAFDVREQAVSDFVTFGYRDVHDLTFFEGVESFPRASWSWIDGHASLSPTPYWDIPRSRLRERDVTPDDAAAQLRSILSDSVRLRLRADVTVGVEFSGGTRFVGDRCDCGRQRSQPPSVHSLVSGHRPGRGALRGGSRTPLERRRRLLGDPARRTTDFFDAADDYVWHMDEPIHSPNLFANHQIWREMKAQGVRVSLSGAGGDELFCGYGGIYFIPFLNGTARTRVVLAASIAS